MVSRSTRLAPGRPPAGTRPHRKQVPGPSTSSRGNPDGPGILNVELPVMPSGRSDHDYRPLVEGPGWPPDVGEAGPTRFPLDLRLEERGNVFRGRPWLTVWPFSLGASSVGRRAIASHQHIIGHHVATRRTWRQDYGAICGIGRAQCGISLPSLLVAGVPDRYCRLREVCHRHPHLRCRADSPLQVAR